MVYSQHARKGACFYRAMADHSGRMQVMKSYEAQRRGISQKELDSLTVLGAAGTLQSKP